MALKAEQIYQSVVAKWPQFINYRTVQKAAHEAYGNAFRDATGLYPDIRESHLYLTHGTYEFDLSKSLELTVMEVTHYYQSKGLTMDMIKTFSQLSIIYQNQVYKNETGQYHTRAGARCITELLVYLVYGTTVDLYKAVNDVLVGNYISINDTVFSYTLENVTVRGFQNGRLDLKGLTTEQQAKFDELLVIPKQLRS